ncbi:MAG: hypothetical protein GY788_05395, partial [bacterium]|nr:hypothetical protein [bacterium]
KGLVVGQAVYSTTDDFDPQSNTIVRVEAGRLRRNLSTYYHTAGKADPIVITIPKGTYTPEFRWNDAASGEVTDPVATAGRTFGRRGYLTAGLMAVAAMAAAFTVVMLTGADMEDAVQSEVADAAIDGPYVVVVPLAPVSGDPVEKSLSLGLSESIISDLSKLPGISVMAPMSTRHLVDSPDEAERLVKRHGATHLVRGSLQKEADTIRINVQLVDLAEGKTIWAKRFDADAGDPFGLQDQFAYQLGSAFSEKVGAGSFAQFAQQHNTSLESLALFRQALELMMPPNEPARVRSAQELFSNLVRADPEFAGGYAGTSIAG